MRKKKLLIFAHYYYPDVASTAQILKDQAEGMSEEYDVTVICTVPSYSGTIEKEYKTKKYYFENINGVKVIRVRVPEFSKTKKMSRIVNIVAYFFRALVAAQKSGKQDYIFTISQPPILGGVLGVCGKWLKRAKMIYCIQDFNPEQIMAVNYSKNKLLLKILMCIDKFSCKRSDLVITVGRDLVETLINRFNGKKVPNHVMINNWIDEEEIYPLPEDNEGVLQFKKKYDLENKFIFMYSGNIGLYYDLENLIKVLEKIKPGTRALDGREVVITFIGEGSMLNKLMTYANKHNMSNVVFIPYQDKSNLIYSLNSADVHMCVNAKGIKGISCPSKFYGIAAVGKPILGVLEKKTEVRMLIDEIGCGICSQPMDYESFYCNVEKIIYGMSNEELKIMGDKGYEYLIKHMTKKVSISKYIKEIKSVN